MYSQFTISIIRKIFILSVGLFWGFALSAEETKDSAYMALYHHYYQLFDTDSAEEFYKTSEQLQDRYMKRGEIVSYYKIRQNEIFYDADHGEFYKAIKKANDLLEDMKNSEAKHYELPYMSLGTIFEQRGNYRIAVHYYQEALNNIESQDSTGLAHIYSQLANVNVTRNADKAQQWLERLSHVISHDSLYYKKYLTLKGQFHFFKGEKENFFSNKHKFDDFLKRTPSLDNNGEQVMKIMENAFIGKYDKALRLLEQEAQQDYDDIRRCDIRIRIYEMMGHNDWALQETNKRRDLRDSLGNDLLFNNLNEINATISVAKLNEKAAKERERWLVAVIILLLIAFGLIVSRYISHQRYQKKIEKQNEQLEIAIDEAKESERMKVIFLKHIGQEIRPSLNVITGYAQIITNPAFELEEEERNKVVQAIGRNTIAITDIVNDLLEISQEESKERYRKDDHITINSFCRQIMEETEESNKGRLKLSFQTSIPDDFTIQSNQGGIERILHHLLSNALKFTEEGEVELSIYKSHDDNNLHFAVTDTGIGIPEERHEQVFEQFYQLDSFQQGFGIGLSMSRKIAILLGGTLVIDKDYHHGTRMILTTPVK